jgi:hypothetical protein
MYRIDDALNAGDGIGRRAFVVHVGRKVFYDRDRVS